MTRDPLPPPPTSTFIARLAIHVDPPLELGEDARGKRRFIAITGGRVSGERLDGVVLPGGGDWQTVRPDGVADLHARYFLETDSGDRIEVENVGFRHGPADVMQRLQRGEPVAPESYYFLTTPRFFTTSPAYAWLMRTIFLGKAERTRDSVLIDLYAVG
ncbi:DUF3237 domain-containing protein [Chromohalobacter sp.]|uniref:DUF3237 domain-containing protein n=1 Tax=Chromohalobacter sp. TaxID=50740 RepID=UPI003242C641